MPIKQNADGTFTVKHEIRLNKDGVKWSRFKSGIKSKAEANRILNAMIAEAENAKSVKNVLGPKLLAEDAVEQFLSNIRNEYAGTTFESMSTTLKKWVPFAFKGRDISSLKPDEFRKLIKDDMKRSVSQQKNLLKYLRRMFRYFEDSGLIDRSPVPFLQFRDVNKIRAVLSREQFELLLKLAKDCGSEWWPIWEFAIKTGLRNGELFALQRDQIDLVNRLITVSRNWTRKSGFTNYPKNKSHRRVEFPESLLPVIEYLYSEDPESIFVLPRIDAWQEGRQAEVLRAFLAAAGLPRIRFHDLRATWATFLLGQGVPPAKVMAAGGWADLKTVMRYLRVAGIDVRGGSEPFDNLKISK